MGTGVLSGENTLKRPLESLGGHALPAWHLVTLSDKITSMEDFSFPCKLRCNLFNWCQLRVSAAERHIEEFWEDSQSSWPFFFSPNHYCYAKRASMTGPSFLEFALDDECLLFVKSFKNGRWCELWIARELTSMSFPNSSSLFPDGSFRHKAEMYTYVFGRIKTPHFVNQL